MRLYRLDASRQGALASSHELQRAAFSQKLDHNHADGSTHVHEDELVAVFHANVDFDRTGDWAVALDVEIEGERHRGLLVQPFNVLERTPEPQVGDLLPESPHLTLRHTDDITLVSSMARPVLEMNELTVPEAIATGKPVLVAIATPAYCQSRFCGPLMEAVVVPLWEEFGGEVEFVHIEPFILEAVRATGRLIPIPLLEDWQLQTEPWVFIAARAAWSPRSSRASPRSRRCDPPSSRRSARSSCGLRRSRHPRAAVRSPHNGVEDRGRHRTPSTPTLILRAERSTPQGVGHAPAPRSGLRNVI